MATRNQYELNLRITSLIKDEKEMGKWQSKAVTDGIQVYEGFLSFSETPDLNTAIVMEEIDRLERLRKKFGLPLISSYPWLHCPQRFAPRYYYRRTAE